MIASIHTDLDKSSVVGTFFLSLGRLDSVFRRIGLGFSKFLLWLLLAPFIIVGTIFLWARVYLLLKTMPSAFRFKNGKIELDDHNEYLFHLTTSNRLEENLDVYNKIKKSKFRRLMKLPFISTLYKVVKFSAEYKLAADEKLREFERSSVESKNLKLISASEMRKNRISAYSYLS
jgi:hypothetical protein